MKNKRLNFIIGGIAIIVILSLTGVVVNYYIKKLKKYALLKQIDNYKKILNKLIEEEQELRDIIEDTAGKEARQKYKETGEQTVVEDTSTNIYQEGGGPSVDEFDPPDEPSEWDI